MTHYWLTDRTDGLQYIHNPGNPDHGSRSYDGIIWDRPVDDAHLSRRQIIMDGIMAEERDLKVKAERQRERARLADQQDETLANHFGGMDTPEAAHERHRARVEALLDLKKIVDRKTIGEHMMNVLGCALYACFMAAFALLTVACIDAILKIVRAW